MTNRAWVTLATNDSYGLGALVLAHSLRRAGSAYSAVVLITPSVTDPMRDRLNAVFAEVVTVDVLDSGDAAHLALLQRPELGITFTKIHCWNLTQYEKCVFLDADTLVVQNCDELFDREELSAAPDVGWPDCFNSGVFVFRPSAETFSSLIKFAQERGSFDGGDQGLLNSYFSDWAHGDINKHLPFLYNVTSAAFYSYLPAFKQYGQNLKIIHFIGAAKPWLQHFNWESRSVDAPEHLRELLQLWWNLFVSQVHTQLDPSMVEVEDVPATIVPSQETFFHTEPRSDYNHYKPVISPDSEFHWHRPDAQTTETEVIVPTIDMSQFHDPWDIYQGQIPAIADEAKSTCSYMQAIDKQQEIRKHVWEPSPVQQNQNHMEPQYTDTQYYGTHHTVLHHNEINHHKTYHVETHHTQTHHTETRHMDNQHMDAHNTEIAYEQSTQVTWPWSNNTQHYHHHDYYQNQHHLEVPQKDYYDYSNKQIESHPSVDQQSIHHSNDSNYHNKSSEHQDYCNREYPSSQNSDILHSQFNCQREPPQFQEHQEHYSPQLEFHGNKNHEYTPKTLDKYEGIHSSQDEHHNKDINHNNDLYTIHKNDEQVHNSESKMDQNKKLTIHVQNNTEKFFYPVQNRVEYVYCVHFDHEKEKNRQKQELKSLPVPGTPEKVNGFATESEMEDFIIPRHPYDGFYLRHRMIIDSRGRKICTHEIPPTPSPSPTLSPSESPIFFDAITEFTSQEDHPLVVKDSDEQYHSGVAGNLARVSPDAVGTQQEVIDELTRRQGWEAGSIDYMGADSFANIWAKISQTLSQAPASVQKLPTPPPEELPSAKQSDDEPKAGETDAVLSTTDESQKTIRSDMSEQPKETKDDSGKEKIPVESPAIIEASIPLDRHVTSDITAASESTVSLEAIKQPAEAAPLNIAPPVTETSSPEAPAEVKTASIGVTAGAPISEESSTSIEAPLSKSNIPTDTSNVPEDSHVEIPVPVVEAVLAEAAASTDSATPTSEIPKPAIEAFSDAESLNETKSNTTPVVAASEKTVELPKDKSDESVKPPEPEVPKQVPKAVLAESVQVVTSAADPKSPAAAAEAPPSPAVAESTKTGDKPPQPEDIPVMSATDSPPLANTPSKEEIPTEPAAKSEERRRPVGKLHLSPPVTADPLPTPDSELEDAATLAQSIIASELRTPTVTSPSPQTPASPAQPKQEKRLSVEEPKVPTPPIGSVSLSQIGVKSAKEKSTIAAQIESSISDKPMPASPTTTDPKASVEAPKKKVVKKVLKKDSATSGDTPVPPPRKKEKKPKE